MSLIPDIGYHPARVLIVDDERHNRNLLEVMLTPEGLLLQTAASGEEALAMVAQQPPDLILLDIMMPDMDGYQVAAHIKGDLATKNIPIIMLTALDDRDARVRGLSTGAEDFLSKPVDRIELCVRVRNLLRLKAYGNYYDQYSQMLKGEVVSRTADLAERMKQAVVLTEQAALLDLAQDAIVVRDMRDRIVFWSRGAEVMYGWLSKEALGRNPYELLKTEFSEPTEHIEAMLLCHGQWEGEATHHRRDGTRVIVASRWALQRDADGAPVRILTINSDITDRKETDAKRKAAEEALEQIRTDQMRFKDEFLSHVSHELRSTLTAIKQFTSILLGGLAGELNKEQREYQEIVLRNIRHYSR
jgi:two-component system cell cycle sensor histidine kinase/response regulator CckA